jgi:putative oxygen-independent coproporphyrinogen III oxidase
VLKAIFRRFRATVDPVEVTVECNPSSLDRANATAFAAVGVNRLSIGVQSLDAASLRFLGRLHDPESALRAVADAQAAVARVNADVIFGMPGQTPVSLASELTRLVDLGLEHLSVYGLTIEPATRFAALQQQGELELASEDTFTESFREAHRVLEARGFEHYEVSNYAKPGQRARHNLRYWRGEPYLGLGADAVGCLHHEPGSARRYRNQADPLQYIESSHSSDVEVFDEQLGPNDLVREGLMLGLRSHEGVYLPVLARRTGVDPLSDRRMRIEQAVARGDLVRDGDWLKVPPARWLHLDGIIAGIF